MYSLQQDFDVVNGRWVPIVILSSDSAMDFSGGTVFKDTNDFQKITYYCEPTPYRVFVPGEQGSDKYYYWFIVLSKETLIDNSNEIDSLKTRLEASESAILGLMQMQMSLQ